MGVNVKVEMEVKVEGVCHAIPSKLDLIMMMMMMNVRRN